MTDRGSLKTAFLTLAGWGDAQVVPLAGDASNRRYDRLTRADGGQAVLMDAPPDRGEDIAPFIDIAMHLRRAGLSAPQVLARDTEAGFLLLEDLGDALFARVLKTHPKLEMRLYERAVEVLDHLHKVAPPDVARYDTGTMLPLSALCFDWYQHGVTGRTDTDARAAFLDAFEPQLAALESVPPVLVLRDFHAENLIWLPERSGPAQIGLLDFQDAMLGHPAYDLVSLLEDARRDIAPELVTELTQRFIALGGYEAEPFKRACAVLGLQRNLRILGVFARLCLRDGKTQYLDHLPRVWRNIARNLKHPALDRIAPLVYDHLPAPTPDTLDILRSKCATLRDR